MLFLSSPSASLRINSTKNLIWHDPGVGNSKVPCRLTNGRHLPDNRPKEGSMERKLAAILSADVKGYSRLMGEDDEATIRTLTAYRALMTSLIAHHHGRVVDSPGTTRWLANSRRIYSF